MRVGVGVRVRARVRVRVRVRVRIRGRARSCPAVSHTWSCTALPSISTCDGVIIR